MQDLLEKYRFREKIHLRWSDLDEMRHVNNAVYLTYFEQGRLNYFQYAIHWDWRKTGMIQARAEIDYKIPLYLKDNPFLYIRTVKIGNKSMELEHVIVDEQPGMPTLSSASPGVVPHSQDRIIAYGKVVLVAFDYETQRSVAIPTEERAKILTYEKSVLAQSE